MAIGNHNLKDVTEEQRQTYPGMAHFGGTGPKGKRCTSCKWMRRDSRGKFPIFFCDKFEQLTGKRGHHIDPQYKACKYFIEKSQK